MKRHCTYPKSFNSFLIALLVCLYGCHNSHIKHNNDLNGKSIGSIIEKKGAPDNKSSFALGSSTLYEYQYNLYHIFPNYRNQKIIIKELLWFDGNWRTAIWFSENEKGIWISVDNITWNIHEITF